MSVPRTTLDEAFAALRKDLIDEDGPQISTMRNYRFAIVPYLPQDEYKLRAHVQTLVGDLTASGWVVLTLSLQKLLLERVRKLGDDVVERMIEMERRTVDISPERGRCRAGAILDSLSFHALATTLLHTSCTYSGASPSRDPSFRTRTFAP